MDKAATISDFRRRIDSFVEQTLGGYAVSHTGEKVIHDPIWGSVLYRSWEIQLIDSPLLQRLRDVNQLGMADLTYTAARHSRFEHSLGTTAIAGRMITRLRERYEGDESVTVTDGDIYKIRLAALLHDVGHCFFSHLSESVYGTMPEFAVMTDEVARLENAPKRPSPHEIFSYMIISSRSFGDFFYENIDYPYKGALSDCDELLLDAARMVIGVPLRGTDGSELAYMTSIINGEFDADKLDYTQRDSYTAGLAMTYGIDRFLLKLIIYADENRGTKRLRLAVGADALTIIEELLFNRCILFVYMYRHQKVLATESVIRDIVRGLLESGKLTHPCDFLFCTDAYIEKLAGSGIFPFAENDPNLTLGMLVGRIKNRRLPKRIYETDLEALKSGGFADISGELDDMYSEIADTKDKTEAVSRLKEILKNRPEEKLYEKKLFALAEYFGAFDFDKYDAAREEFYSLLLEEYAARGMKPGFSRYDLHICFPKPFGGACSFLLVNKDGTARSAADIAYIKQWLSAFSAEKWKGYVFCNMNVEKDAARAAFLKLLRKI